MPIAKAFPVFFFCARCHPHQQGARALTRGDCALDVLGETPNRPALAGMSGVL